MSTTPTIRRALPMAVLLLVIIWVIQIVNMATGYSLNSWGIIPRSMDGLMGIAFAPFLHAGLWHIVANSVPLFILGVLLSLHGRAIFFEVTILVALLGGLGTWIFGSTAIHLGASGLVFGYWSYLLAYAFFHRELKAILIAIVVIIFYGGMLFGLLDMRSHISWSGHAFGMLAGILIAKYHKPKK
jgi:membrane associated rhomboid family serine protease